MVRWSPVALFLVESAYADRRPGRPHGRISCVSGRRRDVCRAVLLIRWARPQWLFIARLFQAAAILATLSSIYFWYSYAWAGPKIPQVATGHVYALNTHGNIAYLTRSEIYT